MRYGMTIELRSREKLPADRGITLPGAKVTGAL